jgi:hypothetical protein
MQPSDMLKQATNLQDSVSTAPSTLIMLVQDLASQQQQQLQELASLLLQLPRDLYVHHPINVGMGLGSSSHSLLSSPTRSGTSTPCFGYSAPFEYQSTA